MKIKTDIAKFPVRYEDDGQGGSRLISEKGEFEYPQLQDTAKDAHSFFTSNPVEHKIYRGDKLLRKDMIAGAAGFLLYVNNKLREDAKNRQYALINKSILPVDEVKLLKNLTENIMKGSRIPGRTPMTLAAAKKRAKLILAGE